MSQYDGYAPQGIAAGGLASLTPWTENIDGGNFTLSNAVLASSVDADAITNLVRTDKANIFGAFNQTFKNDTFRIANPAVSFDYTFLASAIVADRDITLPLLTGPDTFVMEAFAQILTNKTIDGDDNTLQDIDFSSLADGVDGELITWDAAGVIAAVAVGSVGEVLTSGGVGVAPTFQAGAGGGANTALSNLAATAVNVAIDMNTNSLNNVGNSDFEGFLDIDEIGTPADPAANVGRLYVKDLTTVTTLFFRDSAGTETNLLSVSAGANTALSNLAGTAVNATIDMNSNILDNASHIASDDATVATFGFIRVGNNTTGIAWDNAGAGSSSISLNGADVFNFAINGIVKLSISGTEVGTGGGTLRLGGGNLVFDVSSQNITIDGTSMRFNVNTAEDYDFRIDASLELTINSSGLVLRDARDITVGTTTGTEIATAVGQKLGFWGTTPQVQQSVGADTLANLYTLLRAIGIVA